MLFLDFFWAEAARGVLNRDFVADAYLGGVFAKLVVRFFVAGVANAVRNAMVGAGSNISLEVFVLSCLEFLSSFSPLLVGHCRCDMRVME
jgi:hypothetical protein